MKNKIRDNTIMAVGCMLPLIIWIGVKYCFSIEDRYLPSPKSVLLVLGRIKPSILLHTLISLTRLVIGFISGTLLGIFTGLLLHKSKVAYGLMYPIIQSIRAIPPYASIPFFLLWFGFSEIGKYVILICGITFNLAVATYQTLLTIETKYNVFFKSIGEEARHFTWSFNLPYVIERILPTLRFSLSTAIGLVVVAEMLGAQMGLGYVIQTSRSTYSMDVIFLAAFLFGLVNVIVDKLLIVIWKTIVFWRKKSG